MYLLVLFAIVLSILGSTVAPSQTKLGPSLKSQASDMLQRGAYDSAAVVYERWLAADPQDEGSWYNLSCLYSLSGDTSRALDCLENSISAGWDDVGTTEGDSDLDAIRGSVRYKRALETIQANAASKGPSGFERHYIEATVVGTYVAMPPEDYSTSGKSYPICVILHGSGSTELKHGRMADALGRENLIYIAPRALYPHVGAITAFGSMGYTSWPNEDIDSADPVYRNPKADYVHLIENAIADAKSKYRTNGEVWVLGHSQGAAFTWIFASQKPTLVDRIFCYAGYFHDEDRTDALIKSVKQEGIKIDLYHGAADNVVDPQNSEDLHLALEKNGVDHTYVKLDDVSHRLAKPVVDAMKIWANP